MTVDSNPEVASVSACCMWNTEHWIQQEMSLSVECHESVRVRQGGHMAVVGGSGVSAQALAHVE